MYLNTKLEDFKGNIKVAFIGCGKFISMFLSQYNQLTKIKIDSIIDLKIDSAKKNCLNSGLSNEQIKEINFTNSLDEVLDRDIDIFIEEVLKKNIFILGPKEMWFGPGKGTAFTSTSKIYGLKSLKEKIEIELAS